MENENVVNDTQSAVVAQTDNQLQTDKGGADSGTDCGVADRRQSAKENAGFRKMRLENEALRARIRELENRPDLRAQNEAYLNKLVEDKMSRDLEAIQRVDPEVESLHSLGDDFVRLVENGIDALNAYHAVMQTKKGAPIQQPTTGKVGVAAGGSEFYNSRELDRLTSRDLEDPAVFRKAMRSLRRL